MKIAIALELDAIFIEGMKGRELSLLSIFNNILTETRDHDNSPKKKKWYFDELIERFNSDKYDAGSTHIYYDCLYLFCNACQCGLIKERHIRVDFALLLDREEFNAIAEDEDKLWEWIKNFYKKVSYE
jgi:hypothetical protein